MAKYKVQGPDGAVHLFEGPDDATPEQVEAAAAQQFGNAPKLAANSRPISEQRYNPTEGMSTFDRVAAGAGKAMVDTYRGIKGLIPGVDNRADVEESRRLDAPLMDTAGGIGGNIGGNLLMALAPGGMVAGAGKLAGSANLARAGGAMLAPNTIKGAAAVGAGMGLAQPAVDWEERGENAGMGALAGGGGSAVLKGIAGVMRPNTAPGVRALMAEGVTPTPGQIMGGGFKRAEEGLASLPLAGDLIKGGQTRAANDLNRAAFNRALAPIGETLPKGLQGREAVAHVEEALGKRYDALLPKLTTYADHQFLTEVQSLHSMMMNGSIDPAKAKQFESLLSNQVLSKFQQTAHGPTLTGQTMKDIETDLGQLASKFGRSTDPDQQMVGDALREVQSSLRQNVMRSNPDHGPELKQINEGWANFKRVQKAASSVTAEDGAFSPAQLHSAVKALDRSKDKAGFARGDALMQDLSETGKAVLGNKLPDSGTAYRGMLSTGIGGIPGAAMALPAAAMYSRPGQAAMAALMAKRPDSFEPTANLLRQMAPYTALPGAAGMPTLRQER